MSPTDFLQAIRSIETSSQSGFPTKKEISEKTGLNLYTVKTMLGGLVKNGKLRMEGNWYKFNENNEQLESLNQIEGILQDKQADEYIEAITEENKHDSIEANFPNIKMPKRFQNNDYAFPILRWIMLVIGIGAAVISAYYTQIWQHETLNLFWSWFLSLIMIGFSSAAFLTLIGLLTKSIHSKFSTWLLASIFFILWVICLLYSIQVTVAGRYAQYQEIVIKNKVNENNALVENVKMSNMVDTINSLKVEKTNNQKRLDTLLKQADDIQKGNEVKGESWVTIQSRILNVQGIIASLNTEIENKNSEYEKLLERSPIISSNDAKFGFYDWAAKVYKTDRGNIEWIMLLFPSLFLDIVSPIALAVFMFLGRKKEE